MNKSLGVKSKKAHEVKNEQQQVFHYAKDKWDGHDALFAKLNSHLVFIKKTPLEMVNRRKNKKQFCDSIFPVVMTIN